MRAVSSGTRTARTHHHHIPFLSLERIEEEKELKFSQKKKSFFFRPFEQKCIEASFILSGAMERDETNFLRNEDLGTYFLADELKKKEKTNEKKETKEKKETRGRFNVN